MDEIFRSLCDSHGIFLRREALDAGLDDKHLRRSVRSGLLVRLRHGTYAMGEHWSSLDARDRHVLLARAVLRRAAANVVLSHATAAAVLGLPLWRIPLDRVHTTRLDRRGNRREPDVVQHCGELTPSEVVETDGLRVTAAARTCLDIAALDLVTVEMALPLVDHALRHRLCSTDELDEALARSRFTAGSLANRLVVGLADGRRESVGESRTAYLFWKHGVPKPISNLEVYDETGAMIGRVDFAWPELKVFLEFDGRMKYAELCRPGEDVVDVVLAEKRRQERIERVTGWRCIRLTWRDLAHPQATAAYVRSVLAGGPVFAAG